MALTALRVKGKKVVAITSPFDGGIRVSLFEAGDDYQPLGKPQDFVKLIDEKEYHTGLRKDSGADYVPEFSTNPEWNPEKGAIDGNTPE
jgi:hypothetical protein